MVARNKYWSAHVTQKSRVLMLEEGVFTFNDPKRVARSLARSARVSTIRKGTPYQSAMSMLNFYINRAGKKLPRSRSRTLEEAKIELRRIFKRI